MVNWTDDQRNAIDARDCNLLIAAAAGSGKTAVLVERIIQMLIKDKLDIDRLLIVTFTNAAAGEMRERISQAIMKELENTDANEEHLRTQLHLINRASISTLHAFCIDVVKKYFHLIDIDPHFRIGDSTETTIMKLEAVEELFESQYEKEEEYFLGLVERFGGNKEDTPLGDLVLHLYEFIQSQPYPMRWLKEKVEDFKLNTNTFKDTNWYKSFVNQIQMYLIAAKNVFLEGKKICQKTYGPEGYIDAIQQDIFLVEDLMNALDKDIHTFYDVVSNIEHKRLGKIDKETDEDLKEAVKSLREEGKDILKKIKNEIFMKEPKDFIKDLNELHPYMEYLYHLLVAFGELYHEKKKEKGIVDFNDLEHYALSILENEEASKEYRKKYEYIFVDEYQDSNIVQETILSLIKRENNLFMVGDVKQSIYRFRLADPSLFIHKYESFQKDKNAKNRRIDLSKNFRSREEIIHGVNFIFKNIMTKELGEIDYDEDSYLYYGGENEDIENMEVEFCCIEKKEDGIDEEIQDLEDMEVEARIIGKKIKELLKKEIYDSKLQGFRKINYKDIVILLRSTKNWAQNFLEVFIEEGIPAYADVNTGYFEAVEVNIFMNLLKVIDNKRQDIPLLSMMRSPIGGFSTEELIKIRTESIEKSYFEAVYNYAQYKDTLGEKCRKLLERISIWKEDARYIPMDELIWKLLKETGYYHYVGAMPGGIQRQANLRVLVDRARQFQETSIKGLFNFIKFIDKLKSSSGDMGTAKTLGENDDVVRIMSIHKSKGLEFPIVIVGGMGKQFNLRDSYSQVLFHKDLGLGPRYVEPNLRQYTDTLPKIIMKHQIKTESLSEEMRILYVAMTRAKDKLILVGAIKDLEKTCKKWTNPIHSFYLSHGKNYMDWIGPVLIRHKDGEKLREWANIPVDKNKLWKDASRWTVERLSKRDIQQEETEKKINQLAFRKFLENFTTQNVENEEFVESRLNFRYPYEIATQIPSKMSVTEIKKLSFKELDTIKMNIPALVQRPKFMEKTKKLTGAQRGTLIHFVMQHLNLSKVGTQEQIKGQIENMIEIELLKREDVENIDIKKILNFFKNSIGKRMIGAKKIYREIPFNFVKKALQVISNVEDCHEKLLIQGIIDCYFEEEDGLVLIDYKTDYIGTQNKEEIINQYMIQIELYKEALEEITKKNVKESYIYLFDIEKEARVL
ncbi:helicase-exonuclease AddAB subunit AddA [Inediibacterium massiliense]|uniref:helicase-exonuclease AddAB subunit AddA n=1 Tax=Inediibacterium massiliense TaxID=1658111 RepID=UPI0006B514E4|nr:helicase-exonuclease AddAB subunit AddA [Inediibacterium massiliense]